MKHLPAILRFLVWITMVVLFCAGCALPQDAETHIIEREHAEIVRASRLSGREGGLVHGLWIDLAKAPAFQFKFPDGKWAHSREITLQLLLDRGMHIDRYSGYSLTAWHPDLSIMASVVGRHQYFSFRIEDNGTVSALTFGACGSAFNEVLKTMDGISFGFPMTVKNIEHLFGPVSRVDRVAIVTGFSCF
jgi:hypothetical protein